MQAFEKNIAEFEGLNTQVLSISVDSQPSKTAWAESIGVKSYPLLSDFWPHGDVAQRYGVLREEGFSERAIFVIDKRGIIRYIKIYPIGETPDVQAILTELKKIEQR